MYSVVKNDGLRLQVTIHGWPTREVCKVHKNSCLHYHGSEFMKEKKVKLFICLYTCTCWSGVCVCLLFFFWGGVVGGQYQLHMTV